MEDRNLALFLHQVINLTRGINKAIEENLEDGARKVGLTHSQLHLLWLLFYNNGSSLTQLSMWGLRHLTTVRDIVNRLEKRGLVMTRLDPEDSRITRVYVTPTGDRLRRESEDILLRKLDSQPLMAELTGERRNALLESLFHYCTHLQGKRYVEFVQSATRKVFDSY
ncbi:MAG: MarR family winged helix-turn-helix transcriptional regulator [Bacillota bacterium]